MYNAEEANELKWKNCQRCMRCEMKMSKKMCYLLIVISNNLLLRLYRRSFSVINKYLDQIFLGLEWFFKK